ncbi:MAG: carboxy-S-adenosyl-L-methionine synthase CmoA [Planctomycetota bacterium]|nr:carboxy-S-adenosyl-L-methionine synthase CmoA [Planctomycetota bacterium]
MSKTDQLFRQQHPDTGEFTFDENVAEVFDDMISRSVPLYSEVQELIPLLAERFDHDPIRIVDLGCSTGTSLVRLAEHLPDRALELIGVDNSEAMLEQCRKKISQLGLGDRITVRQGDIRNYDFEDVSIVLMNYTLQFVSIDSRQDLLVRIRKSLKPGGVLVLSEKFVHDDVQLDRSLVELYFEYKRRNGYSELEISRKRDALENVLVPFSVRENENLLSAAGFEEVELILKWFNFGTFLAQAKN